MAAPVDVPGQMLVLVEGGRRVRASAGIPAHYPFLFSINHGSGHFVLGPGVGLSDILPWRWWHWKRHSQDGGAHSAPLTVQAKQSHPGAFLRHLLSPRALLRCRGTRCLQSPRRTRVRLLPRRLCCLRSSEIRLVRIQAPRSPVKALFSPGASFP